MLAIDFTGSNGNPKSKDSLHYIKPNKFNSYQEALYSICDILLNYDYDGLVDCYGFGAFPKFPKLKEN